MDVILYNPLSRNGNNKRIVNKLVKKLNKKNIESEVIDLTKVDNVTDFLEKHEYAKRFIIIGGDGTLNVLANKIYNIDIKQDIYLFKAGTGNDFIRSLSKKKGLVNIKEYLFNLPKVKFLDQEKYFLNGVGLGLDGLVVHKVNNSKYKNNKFNYFRHAFAGFKEFKPLEAEIIINGEVINEKKTWLVSIMNDKFFGGGMKIAPRASRNEDMLDVVVVKKVSKFLLFLIFPTIYLGLHPIFKRYVKIIKTKEVKIKFNKDQYLQIDGEDFPQVKEVEVTV